MTTTGRSSARLLAHQPLVAVAWCGLLCEFDPPAVILHNPLLYERR